MPNIGMVSTGEQIASDILPREMGDLSLIEPNEAPLVTLLSAVKTENPTKSPRFEFKEDRFLDLWATSGALVAANATSVPVVDATLFVPGTIFMVPPAASSGAIPEKCRVTAVNYGTNTLTVVRGIGGTGAGLTIPANSNLRLLGTAFEEGSGMPDPIRTVPANLTQYTQIFKNSARISRTAASTSPYGMAGGQLAWDHKKLIVDHKRALNSAFLFNSPSENLAGPGGAPVRTLGGIIPRISSNMFDVGGTLTWNNFNSFMNRAFRYGSDQKLALCSPLWIDVFNSWAMKKLMMTSRTSSLGMSIKEVDVTYGKLNVVLDRSLDHTALGQRMIVVDMPYVGMRYLEGNGNTGKTRLWENAVMDGSDKRSDVMLTEVGLEVKQEAYHSHWYNLTGYDVIP